MSLKTVPARIVLQYHPHDNIKNIKRNNRLSQTMVHFVIDRASLFTDHRISDLPIRAKYNHFRTI